MRWLALTAIVFALACGSRGLAPGTPGPVALSASGMTDGVTLRLDLDRASLTPGQEVRATLTIENTNSEPIRWVGGGCNIPGHVTASIAALADYGRDWEYPFAELKKRLVTVYSPGYFQLADEASWALRASGGRMCTADIRVNELAAHGKLTSRFGWDALVAGAPAPNGDVRITGSLDMDDIKAMVGKSVGASVTLPLTGGSKITVSAARAFDAALADTRFSSWVRARFVSRGNSAPAANDVTGSAHLDGDDWIITAAQKTAPAGEIVVHVSALDGSVRSVVTR